MLCSESNILVKEEKENAQTIHSVLLWQISSSNCNFGDNKISKYENYIGMRW